MRTQLYSWGTFSVLENIFLLSDLSRAEQIAERAFFRGIDRQNRVQ